MSEPNPISLSDLLKKPFDQPRDNSGAEGVDEENPTIPLVAELFGELNFRERPSSSSSSSTRKNSLDNRRLQPPLPLQKGRVSSGRSAWKKPVDARREDNSSPRLFPPPLPPSKKARKSVETSRVLPRVDGEATGRGRVLFGAAAEEGEATKAMNINVENK